MALHRDIFWVGRQWAVTGFGMQVIDQKRGGKFDVEIIRLWDEGLLAGLQAQPWFNAEDFSRGLTVARGRYPEPPGRRPPPPLPVQALLEAREASAASADVAASTPATAHFAMSLTGHPAKLGAMWRVRRRK